MTRVAVQVGSAWVRVAVDDPRPRLLAELPAAGTDLESVLAGLFGGPVAELRLVHPVGRCPDVGHGQGLVGSIRAVSAAVAVAAADDTSAPEHVVVDVGHGGAEVALVRAGRVAGVRRSTVGGAALDAVTARLLRGAGAAVEPPAARRVREALSLLPEARADPAATAVIEADDLRAALSAPLAEVVDAVRAVLRAAGPGGAPPVLLIGGVARTPLLAELLDAARIDRVRVLPRPDAAAVLGALRTPVELTEPVRTAPEDLVDLPDLAAGVADPSPGAPDRRAGVTDGPAGVPVGATWLPPVGPARHPGLRGVLGASVAAVAAAGLLAAGSAMPPATSGPAASAGALVQYGYAVALPVGWAHTGGLPEQRRSVLTPLATPDGSDLISVERAPLGYDAGVEPRRARAELRAEFDRAVAGGAPLSGFHDAARFAGRPVVTYREAGGEAGDVDWFVVLDGDAQLSVGCRHTSAGAAAVRAACETVVASLRRTS